MYYAYVIQSEVDGSLYKGHREDLKQRLQQHNNGKTKSIKHKTPYKLIYSEEFSERIDAIKKEKYFKTAAGRRYINLKLALFNT